MYRFTGVFAFPNRGDWCEGSLWYTYDDNANRTLDGLQYLLCVIC